nr:MAG TPA: hypothetical protein [Caudoviricetes sp.]
MIFLILIKIYTSYRFFLFATFSFLAISRNPPNLRNVVTANLVRVTSLSSKKKK